MLHLTKHEIEFFNQYFTLVENRRNIEEHHIIRGHELSKYINDVEDTYELDSEHQETYYDNATSSYYIERIEDGEFVSELNDSSDIEELKTVIQNLIQREMRKIKGLHLKTEPLIDMVVEISPPDENAPSVSGLEVSQALIKAGYHDTAKEVYNNVLNRQPQQTILDILSQYVHIKIKEVA